MFLEKRPMLEYDLLHVTEALKSIPALESPRDRMSLPHYDVVGVQFAARPQLAVSFTRRFL